MEVLMWQKVLSSGDMLMPQAGNKCNRSVVNNILIELYVGVLAYCFDCCILYSLHFTPR